MLCTALLRCITLRVISNLVRSWARVDHCLEEVGVLSVQVFKRFHYDIRD